MRGRERGHSPCQTVQGWFGQKASSQFQVPSKAGVVGFPKGKGLTQRLEDAWHGDMRLPDCDPNAGHKAVVPQNGRRDVLGHLLYQPAGRALHDLPDLAAGDSNGDSLSRLSAAAGRRCAAAVGE